jgi:hypothetical protein
MKPLADKERWRVRGLILGLDWAEEASLARRAEQWALENSPWVDKVKWGQWEGLRRQGENARRWEEFEEAMERWLTDSKKKGSAGAKGKPRYPTRRAWDLPALRLGGQGLKEEMMQAIEQASRPPDTKALQGLAAFLDEAKFPSAEQSEIHQFLRAQRARKFVELLLLRIKILKERPDAVV